MRRQSGAGGPIALEVSGTRNGGQRAVSDIARALGDALKAASPEAVLSRKMSLKGGRLVVDSLSFDLSRFKRVFVIGGGKASGGMAAAVERVLGNRISGGVVNVPLHSEAGPRCRRIVLNGATHPTPGSEGVRGVRAMLRLVGRPVLSDLVICLISGGGSALLPLPARGVGLRDVRRTTDLLLRSGAEIQEINAVRKHLSAVKGGRLAEKLYPATVLSLILSDVVGDRLDTIASGPTVPDRTTYVEAESVLRKYGIWGEAPASARRTIERGATGRIQETPKEGSRAFRRVSNVVVGGSRLACTAAAQSLRRRGYRTLVLSTRIQGESREVGRVFAGILSDIAESGVPLSPPAAIVAGGETTVTVRGGGEGGRNQELALSVAMGIAGKKKAYFASMGTDGLDGPTRAAGAVVDSETVSRARRLGLDPGACLRNNDSNAFFRAAGGLVVTGPTGTNVNDVMIALVRR